MDFNLHFIKLGHDSQLKVALPLTLNNILNVLLWALQPLAKLLQLKFVEINTSWINKLKFKLSYLMLIVWRTKQKGRGNGWVSQGKYFDVETDGSCANHYGEITQPC